MKGLKKYMAGILVAGMVLGSAAVPAPVYATEAEDAQEDNGDDVEIKIPWQLLNFSDPSRMQIHDDYYDGNYGIEPLKIKEMFIGLGGEGNTIKMGQLKLEEWENTVSYHERLKEAYNVLKTYWTGRNTNDSTICDCILFLTALQR